MKAKKISGIVQVYSQVQFERQFNNYTLSDGRQVVLFYLSHTEVLESEGFFDVILPQLNTGEKLGAIYFDEQNRVFTYPVEIIPTKTPEEIQQEALEVEKQKYLQRSQDGAQIYAGLSAEFRLAKVAGIITEGEYNAIEKLLIPTRNEVLAGQWISALNELESLGSEAIGVDLYNRLHLQISTYINENY